MTASCNDKLHATKPTFPKPFDETNLAASHDSAISARRASASGSLSSTLHTTSAAAPCATATVIGPKNGTARAKLNGTPKHVSATALPHHPLLRLEVEPRLVKVRIQQLPRQRVRGDGSGERARDERSGDGHEGDADADRDGDARRSSRGLRPRRRDAQGPQAEAVGGLELRDAGGAQRREGRRGGGRGGDGPRTGR